MPTWAIVLLNVAAVVATVLAAAAIYFRGKTPAAVQLAAQPLAGTTGGDNAKLLAEVGKALDLYADLIAAGKTPEEARTALAPVVQTLAFPVQAAPAATPGAAK